MCDLNHILCQGRGSEQWITLIIFIIIIVFNVLGGLIKTFKEKADAKAKSQKQQNEPLRYKPADQWKSKPKPQQNESMNDRYSQSKKQTHSLSPKLQEVLEQRLNQKQQLLQRQRMLEQRYARASESQEQRQQRIMQKRRQRQAQNKLLEKQKKISEQRKIATQKKVEKNKLKLKTSFDPEPSFKFDLTNASLNELRNIVVASEILSKPVALREPDERIL